MRTSFSAPMPGAESMVWVVMRFLFGQAFIISPPVVGAHPCGEAMIRTSIPMHHFGHFDAAALDLHPAFGGHADGYRRASLVDHATGSLHTGLSIDELTPGGTLPPHVHSYEESFYLLAGEAILRVHDQAHRVRPGDFGVIKVGTVHAWRAVGTTP